MVKVAIFSLVLLTICRAQAPAAKSSVEGRVTDVAGQPLKNATLRLQMQGRLTAPLPPGQRPAPPPFYTTTSDASGNFAFEGVDAARYSLAVQRTGYLNKNYESEIDLTRGQPASGISIKLTPEGRIDGRVTNEDGEPVPNAIVSLHRWGATGTGLKQLGNMGGRTSVAADGSFVIAGLTAGHYYVSATVDQLRRDSKEAYLPVFYPSASDVTSATEVEVSPGSIARGIDIRAAKTKVYHVRGYAIVTTTGAPAAGMYITPYRDDPGRATGAVSSYTIREDGTFDLENVAPGAYILQTRPRPDRNNPTQSQALFGSQSIIVTNEDLEDVVVRLNPGAEIAGKIRMEDNSPLPSAVPAVNLVPIAPATGSNVTLRPSGDGGTLVQNRDIAPAKYYPFVLGVLPPGLYVKSIRFGDQEISGNLIDLTSGGGGTLEIILSPHGADVTGTAAPGLQVALWMSGNGFVPRMMQTGPDGVFHFPNLPPGEYHMAAGSGIFPVNEVLSQFQTRTLTVRLKEDEHQTNLVAPVIRQDAIDAAIAGLK